MPDIRQTKLTLLLADYAAASEGKLNVIGGGWTITGPSIPPFAIAALIEMPWESAGERHTVRFDLLDDQGKPVLVPGPDGDEQPLVINGQFEFAPQPGIRKGTPLTMPIAIQISSPPQIPPGSRFEWRVEVDGETHEDWRIGFSTRPAP